jgi:hypothetical protein
MSTHLLLTFPARFSIPSPHAVRLPATLHDVSFRSPYTVNHSECTTSAYFPTFMGLLCLRADSFRCL